MEWEHAFKWFFLGLMCGFGVSILGIITIACNEAAKHPDQPSPYTMGTDPASGKDVTRYIGWCSGCGFKFPLEQLYALGEQKFCSECAEIHFPESKRGVR